MHSFIKVFVLSFSLLFFVACGASSSTNATNELGAFHNKEFSIDFDDSWKVIRDFQILQDDRISRGNIVFTVLNKDEEDYSALTLSKDEYDPQKDIEDFAKEIQSNLEKNIRPENLEVSDITINSVKTKFFSFNIDKQNYYISFVPKDSVLYYFVGSTTDQGNIKIDEIKRIVRSFYFIEASLSDTPDE